MHTSVTGIVTRYVDYKENDRIITIFSREQGRVDARARGCRKAKSPLLPGCQPFVFGEFQLFLHKEDKAVVNQCEVKENFYHIREDVERLSAGVGMLLAPAFHLRERRKYDHVELSHQKPLSDC